MPLSLQVIYLVAVSFLKKKKKEISREILTVRQTGTFHYLVISGLPSVVWVLFEQPSLAFALALANCGKN